MTKIDIYSGFLGAGKTTLIKKMIREAYKGQKLMLIENEFGEIGIDGGFLQDAGIEIKEMNSGCICCSLVGDFGAAMEQAVESYAPDRILIEPSGVGKLSDVVVAVQKVMEKMPDKIEMGLRVTVADAGKCKVYMRNFGEFYENQLSAAGTIVLSRTDIVTGEKLDKAVEIVRGINPNATLITTPVAQLSGEQLLTAMEQEQPQNDAMMAAIKEEYEKHHHDHEHCCHHDHDHEHEHCHDHEHEHEHEHCHDHEHEHEHCHDHEHEHEHCHDHEHEHEHHHDHDGHCCCGHDHHHHHADEVFSSWGTETHKKFTEAQIHGILEQMDFEGNILRAKGIVADAEKDSWIYFDYVPGEINVRTGPAAVTGSLCVIGTKLQDETINNLFGV